MLLGSTAQDGRLLVMDLAARRKHYETVKPSPLYALAFHPKGTHVAYGGQQNEVYQYQFDAEREEVISKGQPFWITCLGYSPDGGKLAVGDESCDIWLYDVAAKDLVFHNKHHVECWLGGVAWAPDNETFLFACRPNSHAGKPAIFEVLTRAEAARCKDVRKSRDALSQALAARLAEEKDPEAQKAIESYRLALVGEEKVQMGQWISGGTGFAVAQFLLMQQDITKDFSVAGLGGPTPADAFALSDVDASGAAMASAPSLDKLPLEIQRLAKEHQETMEKEVAKLKSNFCVNQWKVKGK